MNTEILSCGDAIELMRGIPDKSIDMVFTDPPYGTTHNKWDVPFDLCSFWKEISRITHEHSAILIWGQPPFTFKVAEAATIPFRYEWIVEKTAGRGFLNAKKMPLRAHETVMVFYKKLPVYNPIKTTGHERKVSTAAHKRNSKQTTNYGGYGLTTYDSTERYPRDVIKFSWDTQKSAIHPTQKPVSACEYFIRTYTDSGGVVLDPFMGSGSAGVACRNIGNRVYLGFEKDEEIFNAAVKRIAAANNIQEEQAI